MMVIGCPQCGSQLQVPANMGGRQGQCLSCHAILNIPMQMAAAPQAMSTAAANQFDEDLADYRLAAEPPPSAPPVNINAYAAHLPPPEKDYSGAFGLEKRALDAGFFGGIGLMLFSVVWLVGGLAVGYFFPYPVILFFIGLVGCIRGLINAASG
jgi:hypothetical protein